MGLSVRDVITNKVSCLGIIKENFMLLFSHILSCQERCALQCVDSNSLHLINVYIYIYILNLAYKKYCRCHFVLA